MDLSETEKQVIQIFKSAGFSGRVFRTEEACERHLEATRKPGIYCPGYRRTITEEACSWHREERDPQCHGCGRQKEA